MKWIFILFSLFILPVIPCEGQTAQKPKYAPAKEKHKNKTDELDRKQGLWKHYNYEGTLIWEIEYLDDRRHGISKRYYGHGRIMRETEYQYGLRDGIFKRYGVDGVLAEGEYELGKKANRWVNYFTNGQVKSEGLYVNGLKNGEWKYYNLKGVQVNTIVFKNGKDLREIVAAEKKTAKPKNVTALTPSK